MRTPLSGVLPRGTQVVGALVRGECHVSAGRVGGHDRRKGHVEQQLPQVSDHRAGRPAPDAREGTPRHCHHDPRAAEPRAQQWCAPSERGTIASPRQRSRGSPAAAVTITTGRRKSASRLGGGGGFRAWMTESRAATTSATVANRSSGDFARHRRTICDSAGEISGFTSERSGGCSVKTASRVSSVLSPVNGRLPASIS